jgi:tyrosyl-tRNA synthetase
MLLQAFDFYHLCREFDCELQVGGSDQWGNITAGIDLCRKKLTLTVYGLTQPLITKADGSKFGKTETGTVWLDPRRTSPYRFYQFWINSDDRDAVRYLKLFTFLSREEIEEKKHLEIPGARSAPRAGPGDDGSGHGEAATGEAVRASEVLFGAVWKASPKRPSTKLWGEPLSAVAAARFDWR